jgi:hypothetical protein
MVNCEAKNPDLGEFWKTLEMEKLVYSIAIWIIGIAAVRYISWPLDNLVEIWYMYPPFGILCEAKSGNTAQKLKSEPDQRGKKSARPATMYEGCFQEIKF